MVVRTSATCRSTSKEASRNTSDGIHTENWGESSSLPAKEALSLQLGDASPCSVAATIEISLFDDLLVVVSLSSQDTCTLIGDGCVYA